MLRILQRHYRKLYLLFGILALPGLAYVLGVSFFALPFRIADSKLHLLLLGTLEPLLALFLFDLYERRRQKGKTPNPWAFLLVFLVLNSGALFELGRFYQHPGRAEYASVKVFLILQYFAWAVLAFGLTYCVVRVFGSRIAALWRSYDFSRAEDQNILPRKVNIWLLLGFFALGLALRLVNLANFPPYVDEYIHLHAAFQLFSGEPLAEWGRAFATVTLPVLLSFKLFGVGLWAARLPMILINMLAILPLYFLGKKVNQRVGLIAVFLFVLNPWIIAASRTVREYAVLPFYFFASAVLLLDLLDWKGLTLKIYLRKNSWRILLLGVLLAYTLLDTTSTLKVVILNYAVCGGLLVLKVLKGGAPRWAKGLGIVGCIAVALLLLYKSKILTHLGDGGTLVIFPTMQYWQVFVSGTYQHWFPLLPQIGLLILAALSFFGLRAIARRGNRADDVVGFVWLVFAGLLGYLTFFLVTPKIPGRLRYGVLLEYWYVMLAAVFVYILYRLLWPLLRRSRLVAALAIVLAACLLVNLRAITYLLRYDGGGALVITGEKHYQLEPAYRFLLPLVKEQDLLLVDYIGRYDEMYERQFIHTPQVGFLNTVIYGQLPWTEVVDTSPQGWIVLTDNSRPEKQGLSLADVQVEDKQVYYLGRWGECYVWHWVTLP